MLPRRHLPLVVLLLLTVVSAATVHAAPPLIREGRAVTGLNRILGQPIWDLPAVGQFGFTMLGAYAPGASDPLPLLPGAAPSTVLATYVDPVILAAFGAPAPDPALLNVPLRDVAGYVTFDGQRGAVPDHLAAGQLDYSRTAGTPPITLGQWLRARATAKFRCNAHGSEVEIRFRNMIPTGLYTVWAVLITPNGPFPVPLGGVPNAFMSDERGDATFSRQVNFCPQSLRPGESPLALIEVILHTDFSTYASVPELITAGFPSGVVTHAHVDIPVDATPIQ